MNRIARPESRTRRTSANSRSTSIPGRLAVGSSSTSIWGGLWCGDTARATATAVRSLASSWATGRLDI